MLFFKKSISRKGAKFSGKLKTPTISMKFVYIHYE
ncbi:MAG: hypothetical protein SRB1_00281 [Desulfobacteraceae bacterium Eth-SRB1]|nr:MAG: hypothetical protein SRB1_00281 [Desulfobacteraceae bacterium Eth-SRB1]